MTQKLFELDFLSFKITRQYEQPFQKPVRQTLSHVILTQTQDNDKKYIKKSERKYKIIKCSLNHWIYLECKKTKASKSSC